MPFSSAHRVAISVMSIALAASHGSALAADSIIVKPATVWQDAIETRVEAPVITQQESVFARQASKNYLIPAVEIVGFDLLLSQFNRRFSGSSDYDASLTSVRNNLTSSWNNDKDPFQTNQLGHPYQGSM